MSSENGKILSVEEADQVFEEIKIDPAVPSIEDAILMLLSVLPESPIISRTLMMKEIFLFYADFLKQFGIPSDPVEDAGFFAYKYGPYSLRVNISLASLALAGKITITDYADYLNESRKKEVFKDTVIPIAPSRYQACFQADIDFNKVAERYAAPFNEQGLELNVFKDKLAEFKKTWDQKTARGIIFYIYNDPAFRKFIEKSELKDKYPEAFGGRIKEDYVPRNLAKWGRIS